MLDQKKKLLFFLIFTLLVFAFLALPSFAPQNLGGFALPSSPLVANFEAFAQDLEVEYPTVPGAPLSGEPTLPEYIKYLYNFSIIIAGLIAFFSLVYGGFRYLASVGSPVAMADARDQITAGIVGLIILLGSYMFLTIVNPELAILKLDKIEFVSDCGNDICEPGEGLTSCPADCQITRVTLTSDPYKVYELPIGRLIENALEPVRLAMISGIANQISNDSGVLRNKAVEFWDLLNQCSCGNTNPSFSCVPSGLGQACPAPLPPPAAQCVNDPCPDRASIVAAKNDLPGLADNLAATIETMLPPLTSLKKDERRLKIGAEILKETIFPINYDNLLEMKQVIMDAGGEVGIVPFIILGQRIPGRGDPATFYTDEEEIKNLLAGGRFPSFPRFDTLTTCNECQIDIRFADFDISDAAKAELAAEHPSGKITDPCPGGMDCWDYVVNWAKNNGWNPAFLLALWGEETGFSRTGAALGCIYYPTGDIAPEDIVSQLDCFEAHDGIYQGYCQTGNTEFCGFMRYWSGGASCTLSNNPNFWPNLFPLYERLIPTAGEEEINPAAPSGNCTLTSRALPPGLAGCPLEPGIFSFNGGWHSYCRADGYYHDAVDLGAFRGTPIYAVSDGVVFAKESAGLGVHVVLQATNPETGEPAGIFVYAHLTETSHTDVDPDIPADGRWVAKGENIGFVDDTGASFGDHLHFAYYPNGVINSANAVPIECLGIECISVTSAYDWCTGDPNPPNLCQ